MAHDALIFWFQCFFITSVFVLLHTKRVQTLLVKPLYFRLACLGIVVLQLCTAVLLNREIGDVMLFAGAGWHLRHAVDFYFIDAGHTQYPFFPFLIFLHAGLNWFQEIVPVFSFSFYLKIVLSAALWIIGLLISREQGKKGRIALLQFVTHPLTTAAIFFHGQVDVILLAFFTWSVWWISKRPQTLRMFVMGVGLFAASVATKTWSIIFLPFMLLRQSSWVRRLVFVGFTALFLLADVVVYTRLVDGSSVRTVLPAVLKPGGPVGEWGVSLLLSPWGEYVFRYNLWMFASVFGVLLLVVLRKYKGRSAWDTILLTILAAYIALPNWGVQYLFWSVPFLYLAPSLKPSERMQFTLLAATYALLSYTNIAQRADIVPLLLVRSVGVVLWLYCMWLWKRLLNTPSTRGI